MKLNRGLMMLLIALVAGVSAVAMASRILQSRGGDKIAVAAADVEIGARLTPEMLKLVDWPSTSVPPGSFADVQALSGRVVKTSVTRGEPFIEAKLAPIGTKGGLSAVVAEGKRAMTVRVNDVVGVAGFALPGNFVDIMVNTQNDASRRGEQDKAISKIVLERILVLAVAQESNRDETKPKVVNAVTLEVTPGEAENLDLARSVGTLSLVLRNQIDPNPGETDGATKLSLLKEAPPVVVAAAPKPVAAPRRPVMPAPTITVLAAPADCVAVIRGTSMTTDCF
jgi:pilus assembly protein CpaB